MHVPIELAVLVAASLTATITRYVALRTWVFARRPRTLHAVPGDRPDTVTV